jgi:hypothetical protein
LDKLGAGSHGSHGNHWQLCVVAFKQSLQVCSLTQQPVLAADCLQAEYRSPTVDAQQVQPTDCHNTQPLLDTIWQHMDVEQHTHMPNMMCLMGCTWLLMSVSLRCWALSAAKDTMRGVTVLTPPPSGNLLSTCTRQSWFSWCCRQ